MIKRSFLLSVALWAAALVAYPQTDPFVYPQALEKGYVYLRDGTVIKGKYVYSAAMDKIRVVSGNESKVYDLSEVLKVSSRAPEPNESSKRFFNLTEIGLLPGNANNRYDAPFIFHTSLNYNLRKNLSAGVGVGVEFYEETYMPVTANLLYRFSNRGVTPFVMLQGGYQIPIEGSRKYANQIVPMVAPLWGGDYYYSPVKLDAKGGFMMNPSAGIFVRLNAAMDLALSMGYRYHRLNYSSGADYVLDVDYNRLSFKLGITIK